MRFRNIVFVLIFAILCCPLFAQEEQATIDTRDFGDFEKGDGILSLSLGTGFSLGFTNMSTNTYYAPNTNIGFAFSLCYTGFLNQNWTLSGDASGGFIETINDRRLFYAPIALRAGYAINLGKFFIIPSLGTGFAISSLGSYKHIDLLLKGGAQFFWRYSSDISYSLNIFADFIPQLYKDSTQNAWGYFLNTTLSIAYHI